LLEKEVAMSHRTSYTTDDRRRDFGGRTLSQLALLSLVALLATVIASAGGDPWKEKSYEQWDAKDVHRVLFESPWAQRVEVGAPWRMTPGSTTQPLSRGGSDQAIGTMATTASPGVGAGGGTYASGGGAAGQGAGQSADQTQGQTAVYLVRWASSRAIREANVRNAILNGQLKEADAAKYLQGDIVTYQLLVFGPDMAPFNSLDDKTLLGSAYIRPKKAKSKVSPSKVEIQRDPSSKKVMAVVFFFAKQMPDGEPTIHPDEKGIEFVLDFGKVALKTSFEPQKMADKQGQDL
jgi:hypothetical protein